MRRVPTGATVLGSVALAGAAGLLAVTVLRAVSVDPVGEPVATVEAPVEAPVDVPETAAANGVAPASAAPRQADAAAPEGVAPAAWNDPLTLAVDNDPFSPERRPPARRYQLPAERVALAREEPRERPEAPDFRVVGAAAIGGTGLALVQIDRDEPRLVALGESLRGYTLAAVDGESATLEGPAGSLRYPVLEPLSRRDDDDDDRRRRRGRDDDDERRAREAQERMDQMREQLLRVRNGIIRLRTGGGGLQSMEIPPGGGRDTEFLVPVPNARLRIPGGDGEIRLPPSMPVPRGSGDRSESPAFPAA